MEKLNISGVYVIECLANSAKYVGQANVLVTRLRAHRRKLLLGLHEIPLLQADWNKFGQHSFLVWTTPVSRECLDAVERQTTLFTRSLEDWGGYNRAIVKDRSISARIRDTETKLIRARKFSLLPNITGWERINPIQLRRFCQSSVPMEDRYIKQNIKSFFKMHSAALERQWSQHHLECLAKP